MLLCDYAAVAEGKLFISGAGWAMTGPAPASSAIALLLDVPWDQTNRPIAFRLDLQGADGQPVMQPGVTGETPVEVSGQFEVGRPVGIAPGTPLAVPLALNFPPLNLTPGQRYTWTLSVNGEHQEDWYLSFTSRPFPNQAGLGPAAIPPL